MTQNERTSVIRALKCISQSGKRYGNPCEETGACEYAYLVRDSSGEPYYPFVCNKEKLCNDAIELLKAQEPRVLTLEEAANRLKEPVFLEWKTKRRQSYTGWVLVYDVQKGMGITGVRMGLTQPGHITSWYPIDLYDIKWRCWSAKPSDDQMEGTPWEK